MPGADASQFTRFKKANSIQKGDTQQNDPKSVNRLTQYVPRLTGASNSTKFLSSITKTNTNQPTPVSILINQSDLDEGSLTYFVNATISYSFKNNTDSVICVDTFITMEPNEIVVSDPSPFSGDYTFSLQSGACTGNRMQARSNFFNLRK